MTTRVADPELNRLMEEGDAWLDAVGGVGVSPVDGRDAYAVIERLEAQGNRLYGLQVGLLAEIGRRGLHRDDGHRSAKAMVAHGANLCGPMAHRRAQTARAIAHLPTVAARLAAGTLGVSQVDRIARSFANPRVRDQMIAIEADLATAAVLLRYDEFDAHLSNWERLADEDGAGDRADRTHANRNFTIHIGADGSVRIDGGCGAMQGVIMKDVFDEYVEREWRADWAEARARLGDDATMDDLARTDRQRRMDAVAAIFDDAIAHRNGGGGSGKPGQQLVTDFVIDALTAERTVQRLCGTDPGPDPRLASWWADVVATVDEPESEPEFEPKAEPASRSERDDDRGSERPGPGLGYRCGTLDGHLLDPRDVVAAAVNGHLRRVVVGADSVVLDMSERVRCFTGARQTAVRLTSTMCAWPGCDVPVTRTQSDHMIEFNGPQHGRTSPENGAPLCGTHNRHKTAAGFTITRDRWGRYHLVRADGTALR